MRLLSWNVQWCRGVDGRVDPARIATAVRGYDADVVCLQEVASNFPDLPGSAGEDQFEELQKNLSEYQCFSSCGVDLPAPNGRRSRFGNLILSRLAVGRVLRHSLPWPPATVPSMPRAAVEAVVRAPFGALRVLTTHLEYYSSGHRAAQVERLRELHCETRDEAAGEEGPFRAMPRPQGAILCGDFNLPPEDPLRLRITEPFPADVPAFVDAWVALHPGAPHPHTFRVHERDEGESPYCCDYVFLTEDLVSRLRSIRVDAANRASDHQPLIVEIS